MHAKDSGRSDSWHGICYLWLFGDGLKHLKTHGICWWTSKWLEFLDVHWCAPQNWNILQYLIGFDPSQFPEIGYPRVDGCSWVIPDNGLWVLIFLRFRGFGHGFHGSRTGCVAFGFPMPWKGYNGHNNGHNNGYNLYLPRCLKLTISLVKSFFSWWISTFSREKMAHQPVAEPLSWQRHARKFGLASGRSIWERILRDILSLR